MWTHWETHRIRFNRHKLFRFERVLFVSQTLNAELLHIKAFDFDLFQLKVFYVLIFIVFSLPLIEPQLIEPQFILDGRPVVNP